MTVSIVKTVSSAPSLYIGLSTDAKSTDVEAGTKFYESDTGRTFVYNGTAYAKDIVQIGFDTSVAETGVLVSQALITELITQTKITNAHLAELTGDVRDETDIPVEA